jgi:tripartite-type tricarboxylate transporter receptor subunit TctC
VQDLLGGQVDLFFTTPASVVGQIKADKLKGLAVTSPTRLASLPQVPTAAESGLRNFDLDSWFALYAPAGKPADIVQRLNAEIGKILATAETRNKADESGHDGRADDARAARRVHEEGTGALGPRHQVREHHGRVSALIKA